jgi:hypothetical protein
VLLTILRFRLLIWWRALRSRRGASQRAGWIGGLALLVIGLVAFQFGRVAAGSTQDHTSVLVDIFGLLGLFVVLFGVSVALTELYVASDIDLLLTAPLRPRTLFALKTLDSARAAAGIGALGLCALAGWGVATGASAPFYLAALLITLLFAAGATLFDICLVLLLTRIVPARRLRDVVLLVGSVGGALLWLFFETARRRVSSNAFGDLAARLTPTPAGWAGHGLAAVASGDAATAATNILALLLATALLGAAGVLLFSRVFLAGLDAMRAASTSGRRRSARRSGTRQAAHGAPMAIALKDWRLTLRDVPYLSSLLPTLIYACAWPLLILFQSRNIDARAERLIEFGALPLVALMAAFRPALAAIAREGAAFDVLRGSPARARDVIAGKTLAVGLPVAAVVAIIGVAIDALRAAPAPMYGLTLIGAAWLGLGCSLIGTAVGAYNPRFDQNQSSRAGQLPTAGCLLYAAVAGLFGVGVFALVAALISAVLGAGSAAVLLALGLALFALGLAAVAVAVTIGLRRLATLLAPEE